MSATGAAATAARHHHRKTPPSPPLTGPQVTWTGRTTRAPRRRRFPPTCARANKKARWGEPPGLAPSPLWEPLPVRPPPAHPPRPATSRTAELSVSPPPPPPPPVALASQGPHRRQTDPSGGGDNQESKKKKNGGATTAVANATGGPTKKARTPRHPLRNTSGRQKKKPFCEAPPTLPPTARRAPTPPTLPHDATTGAACQGGGGVAVGCRTVHSWHGRGRRGHRRYTCVKKPPRESRAAPQCGGGVGRPPPSGTRGQHDGAMGTVRVVGRGGGVACSGRGAPAPWGVDAVLHHVPPPQRPAAGTDRKSVV